MTSSSNGLRFLSIWILWSAAVGIAACTMLNTFSSQRVATLVFCSCMVAIGCAMEFARQKMSASIGLEPTVVS